jgi:hypothetical protein
MAKGVLRAGDELNSEIKDWGNSTGKDNGTGATYTVG